MKILQELRKATDRDADYCEKELETISRGQGKNREFIRRYQSWTKCYGQQKE